MADPTFAAALARLRRGLTHANELDMEGRARVTVRAIARLRAAARRGGR